MASTKPTIHILATGGTIANSPDTTGYLSGDDLVANIPEIEEAAAVSVEDVTKTGSSGMTPKLWYRLHERITTTLNERSLDGIVITHGSNTMEETAYFLNLTLSTDVPVVLTAAQRNHNTVGNDGDRNLVDAIRVAGHKDAAGRGVLVTVNDQVHHARDVTKTASGRPDAWTSGDFGVLGMTDKRGLVKFYRRNDRHQTPATDFNISDKNPADFPDIQAIYSMVDSDGTMIEAALEQDVDGIVLVALPTGTLAKPRGNHGQEQAARNAIEQGVPVVVSHRGVEGWPKRDLLEDDQLIWADTLRPQKARILLALGLQQTTDLTRLQDLFLEY